jgi:hypothetical protein
MPSRTGRYFSAVLVDFEGVTSPTCRYSIAFTIYISTLHINVSLVLLNTHTPVGLLWDLPNQPR